MKTKAKTQRVRTPTRGRFAPLAQAPPLAFLFSFSFQFTFNLNILSRQADLPRETNRRADLPREKKLGKNKVCLKR